MSVDCEDTTAGNGTPVQVLPSRGTGSKFPFYSSLAGCLPKPWLLLTEAACDESNLQTSLSLSIVLYTYVSNPGSALFSRRLSGCVRGAGFAWGSQAGNALLSSLRVGLLNTVHSSSCHVGLQPAAKGEWACSQLVLFFSRGSLEPSTTFLSTSN